MNIEDCIQFINSADEDGFRTIACRVRDLSYERGLSFIERIAHVPTTRIDLQVGDRVRFNDKVHPRYMEGVEAAVVKVNRKRVVINIDTKGGTVDIGRFGNGQGIRCPPNLIDKI